MAAKKKASTKTEPGAVAEATSRASAKVPASKTAKRKSTTAKRASKTAPGKDGSKPSSSEASASKAGSSKAASKTGPAPERAAEVLESDGNRAVVELGDELISGKKSVAAQAARVIDAILDQKAEALVPIIDRFVNAVAGQDKRPAQTAANALPIMARIAPARVARHLPRLKESFDSSTLVGKDGLVRTFAALCTASVAYQKRLEAVLNKALNEADAKTLLKWTEIVLPALKGEPHARARATVEARLGRIPKAVAQKIADFLGIKLRLRYR